MKDEQAIAESYLANVRHLLGDDPDALVAFEALWSRGQLRAAYAAVDRVMREQGIVLSPEQRAADEAFYWEFVE